ncbi:MAG: hypothetical protein IPJ37_01830 [Bacteroidales bacterium]|nr:hypothetical protein [Bacteroidales bacterium]
MKSWKTRSGIKILRMLSGRSNVFLLTNGSENILIDTSPANKWNKLEKKSGTIKLTGLIILS